MSVVESVRLQKTIPVAELFQARYTGGRLSLPLNQPILVRFEHVTGLPSPVKGEGYSVFKLRILDTLIDRLSSLKGQKQDAVKEIGTSDESIDARIDQLKKELYAAVTRASATPFGTAMGAGAAENGTLLNVSV